MRVVSDFTIDFQSHQYGRDAKIAGETLSEYRSNLGLKDGDSFMISETKSTAAGWSFGKLFLSLEFVQELYDGNSYEIERSKGHFPEDKFIAWVNEQLVKRGCVDLVLKAADEMRDFGRFSSGRPIGFSYERA